MRKRNERKAVSAKIRNFYRESKIAWRYYIPVVGVDSTGRNWPLNRYRNTISAEKMKRVLLHVYNLSACVCACTSYKHIRVIFMSKYMDH